MLTKKNKFLSFFGAIILTIQPVIFMGSTGYAETINYDANSISEAKMIHSSKLFNAVKESSDEKLTEETEVSDGAKISNLINENNEVKVTEIVDNKTNETITITNTGNEVVIEKTTIDNEGQQQTTQEAFPVIKTDTRDKLTQNKLVYSGWSYTGLAVGRNAFAVVAGMGISRITAAFAAMFSISGPAAAFAIGYMGIKSGMTASNLAKFLDSNGNGWIALYKRNVRNYKNGPVIGTQHRTY